MEKNYWVLLLSLSVLFHTNVSRAQNPVIIGELKKWHKISFIFDGPLASETDAVNPFKDFALNVTFKKGNITYVIPGYFSADGNAALTSAVSGNKWSVHFNPPLAGIWTYSVSFKQGTNAAVDPSTGVSLPPLNGLTGSFTVTETDKGGKDFRSQGWLEHSNEHYFKFKGTGKYFLKNGTNSPENFLAYWEFDNTQDNPGGLTTNLPDGLHHYTPHVNDWQTGDPLWNSKGKGIIGAVNYLSSEEVNAQYFLTMNVNGDGREVYPWTTYDERLRFDVSKLAQWEIVFEHMQKKGILLHVILQEAENDKLLNKGDLGVERKLYYRELIARFGHHNALYWNLGEENNRSTAQLKADAAFFKTNDPYKHPIKVHSKAHNSDVQNLYNPLLGDINYDATSFQQPNYVAHALPLEWRTKSSNAGFKWVIELDEVSGGVSVEGTNQTNYDVMRKNVLWGILMGGGGGSEWYFPYDSRGPVDDIDCEDFRSRNLFWDYGRFALQFFNTYVPFYNALPMDNLISSGTNWVLGNTAAKKYVVYMTQGGSATIGIPSGSWSVNWFNPRTGGALSASADLISGHLNAPDKNDWVALISSKTTAPKQVKLTSPISGATFVTGTNINITANNEANTKVDFYANNTLISTDLSSPYSAVWNASNAGAYYIIARAINDIGVLASDSVSITVLSGGNQPPVVKLISPSNLATFQVGENIQIEATANDSDGSIKQVDFYANNILLQSDATSPYTYTLNSNTAGNYVILAKATDNSNNVSRDSVSIKITNPTEDIYIAGFSLINTVTGMPIAGFDPISKGATINLAVTGKSISIRANTDQSPIGSVRFFLDGQSYRLENSAPYALAGDLSGQYNVWNAPSGSHLVEARAYSGPSGAGLLMDTASVRFTIVNGSQTMAPLNSAEEDSVIVFPNPFIEEFTLIVNEAEKIKELTLLSSSGNKVIVRHDCIEKNICRIRMEQQLHRGTYFLKVRTRTGLKVIRVVNENGLRE